VPLTLGMADTELFVKGKCSRIDYAEVQDTVEHWQKPKMKPCLSPPLRDLYTGEMGIAFMKEHTPLFVDNDPIAAGEP
jgi:hypothetical protein